MSDARGILLEVKRRLGDVNAPVPDESDIMVYLNSALRGIWNYAIELDSPRIETQELVACDNTGVVELTQRPVRVTRVVDLGANRELPEFTPRSTGLVNYYGGMWGYYSTLDGIQILQGDSGEGGNLRVSYYPEFTPLADRDADLPFSSIIDDVVIAWTVRLITTGRSMSVADMGYAGAEFMNSLIHYFEGRTEDNRIGRGPW